MECNNNVMLLTKGHLRWIKSTKSDLYIDILTNKINREEVHVCDECTITIGRGCKCQRVCVWYTCIVGNSVFVEYRLLYSDLWDFLTVTFITTNIAVKNIIYCFCYIYTFEFIFPRFNKRVTFKTPQKCLFKLHKIWQEYMTFQAVL